MKIVFATNNPNKIAEIKDLLPEEIQILSLKDINCNEQLPETQNTLEGNAKQKAEFVPKLQNDSLRILPKTGKIGYFDDYVCDISIKKYGRSQNMEGSSPKYGVTLIDAWPSIVAEVQLSHSGGTEAMKLPVTFQFKKWLPIGASGGQISYADQ